MLMESYFKNNDCNSAHAKRGSRGLNIQDIQGHNDRAKAAVVRRGCRKDQSWSSRGKRGKGEALCLHSPPQETPLCLAPLLYFDFLRVYLLYCLWPFCLLFSFFPHLDSPPPLHAYGLTTYLTEDTCLPSLLLPCPRQHLSTSPSTGTESLILLSPSSKIQTTHTHTHHHHHHRCRHHGLPRKGLQMAGKGVKEKSRGTLREKGSQIFGKKVWVKG